MEYADLLNKAAWKNPGIVSDYTGASELQNPEVMVLIRHRDELLGKRILDIGCGAGRTTTLLRHIAGRYTGIDYSEEMIRVCRERFPQETFIRCDVRSLTPFSDGAFDVAFFSFNGLDYVPPEGRLAGLREIHRVLKEHGLFVFSSHNRNYRHISRNPQLCLCLNPFTQIKNAFCFLKCVFRHARNKKKELSLPEYAVLNDPAHDYALLTYYIEKKAQIAQARQDGFEIIDMYDTQGNRLNAESGDSNSPWIYYVARKVS